MLLFFPGKEMQEFHQLYFSRYRADGFIRFLSFSVQSHLFTCMWHLYRYTYVCASLSIFCGSSLVFSLYLQSFSSTNIVDNENDLISPEERGNAF